MGKLSSGMEVDGVGEAAKSGPTSTSFAAQKVKMTGAPSVSCTEISDMVAWLLRLSPGLF